MPLYIVPTPLGNYSDITLRAKQVFADCQVVIGEEFRPTSTLLKKIGLEQKEIYELNEHSKPQDIQGLVELCRHQKVALVSDCGTPNFCDPGFQLIQPLRREKIPITALPGPSSLALILSLSSQKIQQYTFEGFLPAEKNSRRQAIQNLVQEKKAILILETPYRFVSLLSELSEVMPKRKALIGLDLTLETELVEEGPLSALHDKLKNHAKAEPILLIYPI